MLVFKYLLYLLIAKRKISKGFPDSIVNEFISDVLKGDDSAETERVERIYKHLHTDHTLINVEDLGAGSVSGNGVTRTVSHIVKKSSISRKYGRLLSRIVRWIKPAMIVELGTGSGFSTMYMSVACTQGKILTVEGCREIADLAYRNFNSIGLKNIEIFTGSFEDILPSLLQIIKKPLFILIDGDHNGDHLMRYFETILPFTDEKTVIAFDDIRWSLSMEKAWMQIINRQEVSASIDLFRMGILFFKRNSSKNHFILKF